jgi:ubiquinone/menaquinone biosynthesis C-methylase UbiE
MSSAAPPSIQTYYDRFSTTYEAERHHGYHQLIDELELQLIRQYGKGRDVFEAGCGTGLLLREAARVARSAIGLDLSRGMLGAARGRGLRVVQGSLTDVPLPSESVDLVYSMKVLAHIPPIQQALAELARLVRPGGHLLLEFYNPYSLRYLAKWMGGPARIAHGTTDHDVFTRYDTVGKARGYLPSGVELVGVRGVRIVTPSAKLFAFPPAGRLFRWAEQAACDLPVLRKLGGFLILVARKRA